MECRISAVSSGWRLGYRLTIPCLEKLAYYEFKTKYVDFDSCFGKIQATENGHELWNVECGVLE